MPGFADQRGVDLDEAYSSRESSGLRCSAFRNFLGSRRPTKAMRSTRNPSLPMVDAVLAMYTSMPWITDITAISVVVERIMPEQRQKAAQLARPQRIERDRSGFKEDAWSTDFQDTVFEPHYL